MVNIRLKIWGVPYFENLFVEWLSREVSSGPVEHSPTVGMCCHLQSRDVVTFVAWPFVEQFHFGLT